MDILDLIKKDHRQVETLFQEIENTSDNQQLYNCFNKLYKEINLHTKVEEQIFYPAIRKYEGNNQLVKEAQNEHDEAKRMLEEIAYFSPTSAEFEQKIRQLKKTIQHHIQEEENEVFSQVSKCMSAEEREQLGREFTKAKSQSQSEISVVI